MKERFKKTLTREIVQKDMVARLHAHDNPFQNGRILYAIIVAAVGIPLGILAATMLPALGLLIGMGSLAAAVALGIKGPATQIKTVPLERIQVFQDTVIQKATAYNHRRDYYEHYLIFQNIGQMRTTPEGSIMGSVEWEPAYNETQVGASFFVARYVNPNSHLNNASIFYSMADWKPRDLTAGEIAEELRQEDELIQQLILCNRFPRPKMRKEHFQESPHAFWVPVEKTREQQNVLDRFAVMYFNRDLVGALEFIELYCPWQLQDAAQQQYSPAQYRLLELVEKYAETDKARRDRRERINEVKDTLFRSDKYD